MLHQRYNFLGRVSYEYTMQNQDVVIIIILGAMAAIVFWSLVLWQL